MKTKEKIRLVSDLYPGKEVIRRYDDFISSVKEKLDPSMIHQDDKETNLIFPDGRIRFWPEYISPIWAHIYEEKSLPEYVRKLGKLSDAMRDIDFKIEDAFIFLSEGGEGQEEKLVEECISEFSKRSRMLIVKFSVPEEREKDIVERLSKHIDSPPMRGYLQVNSIIGSGYKDIVFSKPFRRNSESLKPDDSSFVF